MLSEIIVRCLANGQVAFLLCSLPTAERRSKKLTVAHRLSIVSGEKTWRPNNSRLRQFNRMSGKNIDYRVICAEC